MNHLNKTSCFSLTLVRGFSLLPEFFFIGETIMEETLADAIYEVICNMDYKDQYWYMRSVYLSDQEIDWYYYGQAQYDAPK